MKNYVACLPLLSRICKAYIISQQPEVIMSMLNYRNCTEFIPSPSALKKTHTMTSRASDKAGLLTLRGARKEAENVPDWIEQEKVHFVHFRTCTSEVSEIYYLINIHFNNAPWFGITNTSKNTESRTRTNLIAMPEWNKHLTWSPEKELPRAERCVAESCAHGLGKMRKDCSLLGLCSVSLVVWGLPAVQNCFVLTIFKVHIFHTQ